MDNLTHSLFGLTLARTPLGRAGRGTTAALVLASNAPDIDIVATAGGAIKYLQWHRGPTHGALGMIGLGIVSAAFVWLGRRISVSVNASTSAARNDSVDPPASFLMLCAISIVGVICHVLMDVPTSYGTRPLSPFDWHWYAEDWMPIVDVYLLTILGAGLWFGSRPGVQMGRRSQLGHQRLASARGSGSGSTAARQRNASIVLLLMAFNYGLRAASHHEALVRAPQLFGPLPQTCPSVVPQRWIARWPRQTDGAPGPVTGELGSDEGQPFATPCLVEIAAVPDFVSPFRWRVIARLSNAYEMRDIDLLGLRFTPGEERSSGMSRRSVRFPNLWTPAVVNAARSPVAQTFLGFSRFPAARSIVEANGAVTVRWSDMRFVMSPLGDRRPASTNLFSALVRLDPNGRIVEQKLGF